MLKLDAKKRAFGISRIKVFVDASLFYTEHNLKVWINENFRIKKIARIFVISTGHEKASLPIHKI